MIVVDWWPAHHTVCKVQ